MGVQTYVLESTKQLLTEVYNPINLLERGMADLEKKIVELKGVKDTLKEESKIMREKV
jgi:hypothetical protein